MIDFSIVDAHLHLWDITKLNYPWLNDIPALNKTFSLDDYNAACGNIKVELNLSVIFHDFIIVLR